MLELNSSETLFCVMAAINAAGYDEGIDLPDNNPARKQLRDYLAGQKIAVLPDLYSPRQQMLYVRNDLLSQQGTSPTDSQH